MTVYILKISVENRKKYNYHIMLLNTEWFIFKREKHFKLSSILLTYTSLTNNNLFLVTASIKSLLS